MTRVWVAVCALFNLGVCAGIGWRVLAVPENHWGLDHRWLIPWFALQLLLSVVPRAPLSNAARGLLGVSSALALVFVVFVTQRNGLVPYELWIQRGMPAKWQS
ncbi:MAG TPA: hypothetical protein VFX59_15855 [Polyangiales bacterium]|nr:hypothetical protein [Polyangiales bacterium]